MFKARDKYYKACKEELNLPLPDTSKMASEKSHYETRLKATNDAFTKFFRVSFPQKLSEVRNSFVQRVVKVQTVLRSLITSKVESVHILDESINGQLLASLDAINVEEEVTELNKKYNPGNDPFDKVISFEFQEYSDKGHVSLQVIASSAAESPLHLIPAVSSQDTSSEGVQPQSVVPHHPHSSGHMRSRSEIDPSGSKVNDYTPSPITSRRSKSILKMFSSKRSGGHERTRSKSNEFDISQISSNVTSSESPSICIVGPPPATAAVAAADVSLHSTVVMKVPLDALVERERVLNPEANIPRVETFLVESLLALNAPAGVKGIFKRGGKVPFVNALKKSLDEGTFDAPNDPYVCADVLKFWVRSLPEPLIPNSL